MTREEAIRWLEDIHRRFNPTGENLENEGGDVHLQALDMAIETLSAEAAIGDYPNDLISRSALMEYCSNQKSKSIDNNDIARFPSAEAVEVVRCKDCKWYGHIGCAIEIKDDSDRPKPDDFCSFGEKRGDGHD